MGSFFCISGNSLAFKKGLFINIGKVNFDIRDNLKEGRHRPFKAEIAREGKSMLLENNYFSSVFSPCIARKPCLGGNTYKVDHLNK